MITGLNRWMGCLGLVLLSGIGQGAEPPSSLLWKNANGYREARVSPPSGSKTEFVRVDSSASGLRFTNVLALERYTTNQIYLNGSGVTAGDVDGDGWVDLFFAGLSGGSALFHNEGNWRFRDITQASGLTNPCRALDATGAALADLDGDGDLDLIVNSVGNGTLGLRNDGAGRFEPWQSLNPSRGGTSLALADLDGDGDLDLYVANYRPETLRDQPRTNFRINNVDGQQVVTQVNGRPVAGTSLEGRFTFRGTGITENGEPDALFLNDGHGSLAPVPFTSGSFVDDQGRPLPRPLYEWGLSVTLRDLNADGLPDIYVCNDFDGPDRFWLNQGNGRFRAAPSLTLRNTSKFSMGVDVADLNRDGFDDLFVLDMMHRDPAIRLTRMDATMDPTPVGDVRHRPQLARNTLHLSRGDGTFAEIAYFAGLEATGWSWSPVFLDVDLDGFEDLVMSTGHARDDMHMDYGSRIEAMRRSMRMGVLEELSLRTNTPPLNARSLAFRNGGGMRFDEVPGGWGLGDFNGVSHGMCLADLDLDGDLDLVVNRLNAEAGIYRNDSPAPRIAVRLKGLPPNTRGIGARLELRGGALPPQSQEIMAGGRYLSADDALRVFAAGSHSQPRELEVRWRSGQRSLLPDVQPNHLYEVDEASASLPSSPLPSSPGPPPPLFSDQSASLGHKHYEDDFDDFERQPLLPRRLSRSGPGVAWVDLNDDGREDLIIGSGRGGRTAVLLRGNDARFQWLDSAAAALDQTGVVGWSGQVLIGATAYEDPSPNPAGGGVERLDKSGSLDLALPIPGAHVGPLALADFDGDGDLDLFVGGRAKGGRYPEATPSRLFQRQDTRWIPQPSQDAVLADVGLVQGAVWTDLDADGFPELVLACEWGPPRVFRNDHGRLRDATQAWGLTPFHGWWTGLQAADFDGDGRMDLAVGNWGWNSQYRPSPHPGPLPPGEGRGEGTPSPEYPVRLYYGDLGGRGEVDLVEASYDLPSHRWVPDRDMMAMARQLPWVREKFPFHRDYARASVEQLLGERLAQARLAQAHTLASTVFLNRTHHFEARPLPPQAQWSPAFGVTAADFDGDGRMDLFLSQNFFAESVAHSRSDAGRGLLLRGRGNGDFEPWDAKLSGIEVYGEGRGSACADFDEDGRMDLVVTQNGAQTRLFRNSTAKPATTVRLFAGANNPQGLGARLRVRAQDGSLGPALELHGGGGFGCQDAPIALLHSPDTNASIEVLWPGGRTSRHPFPIGHRSLTLKIPEGNPP